MSLKKIFATVAAVVVCVALCTGCYNPDTVATINGRDIPAGLYLYFQLQAVDEAYDALNADGTLTKDAALLDMSYEGVSVQEWVKNRTLELCTRFVFVEEEGTRLGLTDTVSQDAFVDYMVEYYWSADGNRYTANGVGAETYRTAFVNDYQEDVIKSVLFGADGEYALRDEEKDAYFVENFTRIDLFTFPTAKADGYVLSAEELTAVSVVADKMLAQLNAGASFKTAYYANYGEILTITEDTAPLSDEALSQLLVEDNIISEFSTSLDVAMIKDALNTETGSYGMYNNGSIVYLYRVTGVSAKEDYSSYEPYVVDALAQEPFNRMFAEAAAQYTVEVSNRAVKHYSPDNIVF